MTDDAAMVVLGRFGAPHGVRGEIRLASYTEEPRALLGYTPLATDDGRPLSLSLVRADGEILVVRVQGIADRTAAATLTNRHVVAPRHALGPAGDEEYLHADLIGLRAETVTGEVLGRIVAVHDFGAGDILEVTGGAASRLFAFTKAIVPVVDIAGGRVVVSPPDEIEAR